MEPTVSSETSAIRTKTPGNFPKKKTLHHERAYTFSKHHKNLGETEIQQLNIISVSSFQHPPEFNPNKVR